MSKPPFEEVLDLVGAGVASATAARCAGVDLDQLTPEEQGRLDLVLAWREAQIQVRLFSRFEADVGAGGMRAFEEWASRARETRTLGGEREKTIRDLIVDDPALLQEIGKHVH